MSNPWDNEPTPIANVAVKTPEAMRGEPCVHLNIARDLERKLRHAEGLIREHMEIHRADVSTDTKMDRFLAWLKRRDAYLAAAEGKEEKEIKR